MRAGYVGNHRRQEKETEIIVCWADGTEESFITNQPQTIRQKYKQINFIDEDGKAVAINLHQTRYVTVKDDKIDSNNWA